MTRKTSSESVRSAFSRARLRQRLDRAIEAHYTSLTDAERREDERWARLGDETLRRAR